MLYSVACFWRLELRLRVFRALGTQNLCGDTSLVTNYQTASTLRGARQAVLRGLVQRRHAEPRRVRAVLQLQAPGLLVQLPAHGGDQRHELPALHVVELEDRAVLHLERFGRLDECLRCFRAFQVALGCFRTFS